MPTTIVVGAGWAGLYCAYKLTQAGHQVTLIEAAPQSGGRARSVAFNKYQVDNGQHICLGAYTTLRSALKELGMAEQQLFKILPLQILTRGTRTLKLRLSKFPAPYHLLFGILTARGLSFSDKIQAIKFCRYLKKIDFKLDSDCTLLELLTNYHQTESLISYLWEPIALAATTTPISIVSAQVFLNILKRSFTGRFSDSNWYLPMTDLSNIFPALIEQQLNKNGTEILYSQTIHQIDLSNQYCKSISSKSRIWEADNFVLAIPPWHASRLLNPHLQMHYITKALNKFSYQPITTVYLEFSTPIAMHYPLVGMLGSTCQWIIDRTICAQPNILSCVISGSGRHLNLSHAKLIETIIKELQTEFPRMGSPISHRLITEKFAAFTCSPEIHACRVGAKTSISNLWLSGDHLQTELPSTLEGALLSARLTVDSILGIVK
jgi:squalene-associated FAD-dependent desaturase